MRRALDLTVSCLAPLLLTFTGCRMVSPRSELTVLNGSIEPLRKAFNADQERMRVVAIFSPV
ncbi:MAG: hypothetical protein HYR83_09730 [Planctomycetes bacterium]|nr:hypothetical protein [Planctomycetota bacterium]